MLAISTQAHLIRGLYLPTEDTHDEAVTARILQGLRGWPD